VVCEFCSFTYPNIFFKFVYHVKCVNRLFFLLWNIIQLHEYSTFSYVLSYWCTFFLLSMKFCRPWLTFLQSFHFPNLCLPIFYFLCVCMVLGWNSSVRTCKAHALSLSCTTGTFYFGLVWVQIHWFPHVNERMQCSFLCPYLVTLNIM
jgi:hypothetical protein